MCDSCFLCSFYKGRVLPVNSFLTVLDNNAFITLVDALAGDIVEWGAGRRSHLACMGIDNSKRAVFVRDGNSKGFGIGCI